VPTATYNALALQEFTRAGVLVQTIPLGKTTAGSRITATGNNQEVSLNLSANKAFLSILGYDAEANSTTASSTIATTTRVITRLGADGVADYSTKLPADASTIRQVTSVDGSNFWFGGNTTGVRYVPFGNPVTTTATTISLTGATNVKSVNIFNDQLYAQGFNGNVFSLYAVGTGLPTATATNALLPGLPTGSTSGNNGFQFFDTDANGTPDLLYIVDGVNLRKYTYSATPINYISALVRTAAGSAFTSTTPTVNLTGGTPTLPAVATGVSVNGGTLTSIFTTVSGSGYTTAPTVTITGGTGATGTATLTTAAGWDYNGTAGIGVISAITINSGTGYTVAPTVTITGGGGTGATATATFSAATGAVTSITLTAAGTGYTSAPTVTITGTGTGAAAIASVNTTTGVVSGLSLTTGSGYTNATVSFSGGGAAATPIISNGAITGFTLTNVGSGYITAPTITITGDGTGAAATASTAGGYAVTGFLNEFNKAQLFVTTGSFTANTAMQSILDNNGGGSGVSPVYTNLQGAGAGYIYRGIAFTPGTTQSILPVNITSFTGNKTSNGVQLNWATASEINNNRFDVTRSTNNIDFKTIGSVASKGNSLQTNNYTYTDLQPASGFNYYRLNQVDIDGKTTISSTVAINIDNLVKTVFSLMVSGNNLNYTINSATATKATLQLFNMAGRNVYSKAIDVRVGVNNGNIAINELQHGIYVGVVVVDGQSLTAKFFK
jgi:hypothetical protein